MKRKSTSMRCKSSAGKCKLQNILTRWGLVTHKCVSKLTNIGSDDGLSPGRRQAIIWNNARILLIGPLGTHFNEILTEIHTFSFKKLQMKMSSGKWRPFCLGLNVLNQLRWTLSCFYLTTPLNTLVAEINTSLRAMKLLYARFVTVKTSTLGSQIFLRIVFNFPA